MMLPDIVKLFVANLTDEDRRLTSDPDFAQAVAAVLMSNPDWESLSREELRARIESHPRFKSLLKKYEL